MKKSVKRQKITHNKKRLILICLLFIFLLPFTTTFGRYTLNNVKEFFNRSREFYFSSDKLGEENPLFLIDNWSGVDDYTITVNMNSRKNNILTFKDSDGLFEYKKEIPYLDSEYKKILKNNYSFSIMQKR